MEAIENEVKHKEAFAHAEKCRSEGVPCKLKGCEFYDASQEQCCGGALRDGTPLVSVCEKYVGLPPVLDACCGSRMFWFDRSDKRAVFVDKRRERHTVKDKSSRGGSRELIIDPDYVADFTALPFNSGIFALVVFDPPHFQRNGASGWMAKKYGTLKGDWREELRQGFAECFRVLKPNGVLIFKWCSYEVPLSQILALTPERPLFGHRSGKQQKTHWVTFMKPNRTITMHK